MNNYRPICDFWLLARQQVGYYGAYPMGFLERARVLLGATMDDPILHVCGGKARSYKGSRGFGPNDKTLDLDPALEPDYLQDARDPFPPMVEYFHAPATDPWPAILIDRPYSKEEATNYKPGPSVLPSLSLLLKNALEVLEPGGKVGILDYKLPQPKNCFFVASVAILTGFNNAVRVFGVYENTQCKDEPDLQGKLF